MKLSPLTRSLLENAARQDRAQMIIERIRQAGVEGLGGGKFPTAVKLDAARDARAIIINGLQSEPDNLSDIALLQDNTKDTIAGVGLVVAVTEATAVALALPAGLDSELRQRIQNALRAELDWLRHADSVERTGRLVYLQSSHGTGQEHQLAAELDLIGPSESAQLNKPLTNFGVLCLNLATCFATSQAVYKGESLERRMVTVNDAARWVEFGTPVADILNPAWINGRHGGDKNRGQHIDASVFCITQPPPEPSAPCINCSACRPVCPVNIEPDEIHRAVQLNDPAQPDQSPPGLFACIECGACNAACPSGLWLTQDFRTAKQAVKLAQERKLAAEKAKARVQARAARLKIEEEKREARLNARSNRDRTGSRSW